MHPNQTGLMIKPAITFQVFLKLSLNYTPYLLRIACKSLNIKLIELDHSKDKYLNKTKIAERLNQIRNILKIQGGSEKIRTFE